MIIDYPHIILYSESGRKNVGCKTAHPRIKCKCDNCGKIFIEKEYIFNNRYYLIKKEYCGKCARPLMCSRAGLRSAYDDNGNLKPNNGRFSTERVENMSEEEYAKFCEQRKTANKIFHDKLNSDPVYREAHYSKIFKNSHVGYISKGQQEIYELLKDDGFLLEYTVNGIKCDIVSIDKKVVIEYYGDMWHANPRMYSKDDYIPAIKMTAKEKWNKDRDRNFVLRNNGYNVIIIWETSWINDRNSVYEKLRNFKNSDYIFPGYEVKESKKKWMHNDKLCKNSQVPNEEVPEYINNGWKFGRLKKGK